MLLYHNKIEYSRVVEILEITEEGAFAQDQTPEDYSGASLQVEVVHQLALCDAAGCVEILKLDNPTPLNKDKQPTSAAVILDGKELRPATGPDPSRTWTTRPAPNLPQPIKDKADITFGIMSSDGDFGTPI